MTDAMPESGEGVHNQRKCVAQCARAERSATPNSTTLYTRALHTRGIVNAALAMQDERSLVHRGAYPVHHLCASNAVTHPMTPIL